MHIYYYPLIELDTFLFMEIQRRNTSSDLLNKIILCHIFTFEKPGREKITQQIRSPYFFDRVPSNIYLHKFHIIYVQFYE